jgi:TatD DNase family protein
MIDFHAHLDDEKILPFLDEIIKRAKDTGVSLIISPNVNLDSALKIIEISKKFENVLPMIGIHPSEIDNFKDENLNQLEYFIKKEKIIGIGEIGLDYTYKTDKNKQKEIFEKQLQLAEKYKLPVVLHIRETFNDIFEILKNFKVIPIWHSCTGNLEEVEKFLEIGGFISFSGIITFKNASRLREIVKIVPLERIFLETDSPYLTPEPYRGKINEPAYIKFVYQKVVEIRKIEFEEETSLKLDQEDINKISYFTVIKNINKLVHVYLLEKDFGNLENFKPYMISIKIPFHNKKIIIPEVDKIGYFDLSLAKEKLVVYQKILVDKLLNYINSQSK